MITFTGKFQIHLMCSECGATLSAADRDLLNSISVDPCCCRRCRNAAELDEIRMLRAANKQMQALICDLERRLRHV